MLVFTFAIGIWVVYAVINFPKFACFWIHINTIDESNTVDDAVFVSAVLFVDQFDVSGVIFIEDAIIKNDKSVL